MSAPNENPADGQAYVPPAAQSSREAGGDAPKVQIAAGAMPPASGSFAPQVMGAPGGTTGSFAPQVMGAPGGTTGSFAPQVMGPPPAAMGGTTGSFAPQVMGPPVTLGDAPRPPPAAPLSSPGSFAPQVMGAPPAAAPAPAAPPPAASPFAPSGQDAALVAAFAGQSAPPPPGTPVLGAAPAAPAMLAPIAAPAPAGPVEPAPPAMGVAMGAAPPAPAVDDDLAASPWHKANNPGFNRDLLPSAMVASAPEPAPPSKKGGKAEASAEPSRTPWIIVGLLVVVALASGVAVFLIRGKHGPGGQIAVPAGQTSGTDDTPPDPTAPTASAAVTATARPAPVIRPVAPVIKPKPLADDPYADVPSSGNRVRNSTPSPSPTAAKNRVFGTDP